MIEERSVYLLDVHICCVRERREERCDGRDRLDQPQVGRGGEHHSLELELGAGGDDNVLIDCVRGRGIALEANKKGRALKRHLLEHKNGMALCSKGISDSNIS